MQLPDVPGILSATELRDTAASIVASQEKNGLIMWFEGGHADPWNHTEAAMALDTCGFHAEADLAYEWMVKSQLPSGAWHQYYWADSVKDPKFDANVCAYIAAGVFHRFLLRRDRGFLESMWPTVEAAIDWVLDLQTPRGEIIWARHADGTPWSFALLTGSSSICHSLRCAIAIAQELGHERPDWELSAARLSHVIKNVPEAFAPKDRWAMDWYYPMLGGVLTGDAGRERLDSRWNEFLIEGKGIRCVADRPWVTAAETCECALAALAVDRPEQAKMLLDGTRQLRDDDGAYFTGIVFPEEVHFPGGERSTYTAGAVILAADAIANATPAAGLFTDHDLLPELLTVDQAERAIADPS